MVPTDADTNNENFMNLTPHFSLDELTFSEVALRHGIINAPSDVQITNLRRLCQDLLEPVRDLLKVPLHINSGFRSIELNSAVGGTHASAHMSGEAADFVPMGLDLRTAFDMLRARSELPYDQIIIECGAWIHLAIAPAGLLPRRQMLAATGHAGAWKYQLLVGSVS